MSDEPAVARKQRGHRGRSAVIGASGTRYANTSSMVNAGDVPRFITSGPRESEDDEAPDTERTPMVLDDDGEAFDPEASLDVRLGGVHGEDDLAAPDGDERPDNVYEFRRPARALWGIFTR